MERKFLAHEATQKSEVHLFSPVSEPKEEKPITQAPFLIQTTTNLHKRPQTSCCLPSVSSRKTGRYPQQCCSRLLGKSVVFQANTQKTSTFLPAISKNSNTFQFNSILTHEHTKKSSNEKSCSPQNLKAYEFVGIF